MGIIIGAWIIFTLIGCVLCRNTNKLKIMSCRSLLKRYKRLDDSDSKSLF
ncbi:hypothetical protein [Clostridium sp.]|nr:hypothetical protein [Clostridium sp.]